MLLPLFELLLKLRQYGTSIDSIHVDCVHHIHVDCVHNIQIDYSVPEGLVHVNFTTPSSPKCIRGGCSSRRWCCTIWPPGALTTVLHHLATRGADHCQLRGPGHHHLDAGHHRSESLEEPETLLTTDLRYAITISDVRSEAEPGTNQFITKLVINFVQVVFKQCLKFLFTSCQTFDRCMCYL